MEDEGKGQGRTQAARLPLLKGDPPTSLDALLPKIQWYLFKSPECPPRALPGFSASDEVIDQPPAKMGGRQALYRPPGWDRGPIVAQSTPLLRSGLYGARTLTSAGNFSGDPSASSSRLSGIFSHVQGWGSRVKLGVGGVKGGGVRLDRDPRGSQLGRPGGQGAWPCFPAKETHHNGVPIAVGEGQRDHLSAPPGNLASMGQGQIWGRESLPPQINRGPWGCSQLHSTGSPAHIPGGGT